MALPAGEEKQFIAEMAAKGTPVEDMTIKQLRNEIKHWKDVSEKLKADSAAQIKKWQDTAGALELKVSMQADVLRRKEKNFEAKISDLEVDLEFAQKDLKDLEAKLALPKTVEVPPPDYDDLKREVQALRDRPVEYALPDDYESTKHELAALKKTRRFFQARLRFISSS